MTDIRCQKTEFRGQKTIGQTKWENLHYLSSDICFLLFDL